jgi:hypothetical protein
MTSCQWLLCAQRASKDSGLSQGMQLQCLREGKAKRTRPTDMTGTDRYRHRYRHRYRTGTGTGVGADVLCGVERVSLLFTASRRVIHQQIDGNVAQRRFHKH